MKELTSNDISHLASLARLELTTEESSRFADQLSQVVSYVEQLSEVNTASVADLRGVTGMKNVLADDVLRTADDLCQVDRESLLQGSPAHEDNFIVVRAVLGDDVGGA